MSAWFRRACDRAFNLGLSIGDLTRRCHGAVDRRDVVELAVAMEETMRLDIGGRDEQVSAPELSARAMKLFGEKNKGARA